jgi:hypothetical protein
MQVRSLILLLALVAAGASPAHAQIGTTTSIGVGWATPQGDLDDAVDDGYTVRAQLGLSALGLIQIHGQGGWTRFGAGSESADDVDLLHAGVGARVGLGLVFVGANAVYFFGDGDDEVGFFPEIGVSLLMLELVADYNFSADRDWFAVRAALRL